MQIDKSTGFFITDNGSKYVLYHSKEPIPPEESVMLYAAHTAKVEEELFKLATNRLVSSEWNTDTICSEYHKLEDFPNVRAQLENRVFMEIAILLNS